MGITKIGLKRPISALMIILAILVFGIGSLFGFSIELLPEVEMPVLMVRTAYEGADPETVDETVSKVIEKTAETLNGIDTVETYSYENYSMVMIRYEYGTDAMSNYLKLQNALAETKLSLPKGAGEPVIIEMDMETQPSLQISAYAEEEKEVLAFLGEGMLTELENLPAVAKVDVFGGEISYIRVELQQELLKRYGLELSTVAEHMASANFSIPIGTVEQGNQNMDVTSSAKSNTLQEIKEIPLRTGNDGLIRLEDIGEISWAVKDADSISHFNGEENVTISITKSQRADPLELSEQVSELLEKYEDQSNQVDFELIYDGGEEVVSAVKTLGIALLVGAVLAMLAVLLLFGDFRTGLTVGCSVFLSLLLTLIGMRLMGFSMNIVTMGSLIIAIGVLIDSSMIVLESCFRISDVVIDRQEAVVEGTKAVRNSLFMSVVTTIVICLPLAFVKGLSAQLFQPLGYALVFTAAASLLNAAVFVPLMFVCLKPVERKESKISEKLQKLEQTYEGAVHKLMARRELVIGAAIFLFAVSCAAVIYTDRELVAQSDTGAVNISVDFRSGMKLSEVEEKLIVLEELLEESEDVESYSTTVSGSSADIMVHLKDRGIISGEKFRETVKTKTKDYVGIDINVSNVSNMSELEMSDGEEVLLAGYELEEVKAAARELTERYRTVPGVLSVLSSAETEGTKLEIIIDSLQATNYGLTSAQVADCLQEMVAGQEVMTIEEDSRIYSVCLEYPDGMYSTPQNLMNAAIETPEGVMVPLSEIAALEYTDAQDCIVRRDGKYVISITVTCPEKYRDDVRSGMDREWHKMKLSANITREEGNVEKMMNEEFRTLFIAIAAAVFLVFLVLTVRFESLKYALTIMLSIPLGLFGAFLLVFVSGSAWNLVSLIGVLLLMIMILSNGVRYAESAGRLTLVMPLEDALVESGKRLLQPVLVTALAMIAVMLPMAVWPGEGTVLLRGMAVVMIGGIISAAALILLLFPVFCQFLYGKNEEEDPEELEEIEEGLLEEIE